MSKWKLSMLTFAVLSQFAGAGPLQEAGGHLSGETKKAGRHLSDGAKNIAKQAKKQAVSLKEAIENAPNQLARETLELAAKLLNRKASCKEFKFFHPIGYGANVASLKLAKKRHIFENKDQCKNYERNKGKLADLIMDLYPNGKLAQQLAGWDFTYFQCACDEIDWE
jgi:hypothetical protein